jgi:hypothetical protein
LKIQVVFADLAQKLYLIFIKLYINSLNILIIKIHYQMAQLTDESYSNGQHNISFLSSFLLGDLQRCLDILVENGRIPEAAHTYAPSQVPRLVSLWRDAASQSLSGISKKVCMNGKLAQMSFLN